MDTNQIKKALYKQKPDAIFTHIKEGTVYYYTDLTEQRVYFAIPVIDMGEAKFGATENAQLLIRWLVV